MKRDDPCEHVEKRECKPYRRSRDGCDYDDYKQSDRGDYQSGTSLCERRTCLDLRAVILNYTDPSLVKTDAQQRERHRNRQCSGKRNLKNHWRKVARPNGSRLSCGADYECSQTEC